MSIANRHKIPVNIKSFTLLYFALSQLKLSTKISLEIFGLKHSIKILENYVKIEHIYIYTNFHLDNTNIYGEIPQAKIIEGTMDKNVKLESILEILSQGKNIISIDEGHVFNDFDSDPFENLSGKFIEINDNSLPIYKHLREKFDKHYIIDSNILIIPFNDSNLETLTNAYLMAKKLETTSVEIATNLALTLNIESITTIHAKYFTTTNDINLRELYKGTGSKMDMNYDLYLFYPYFDMDGIKTPAEKNSPRVNTNGYATTLAPFFKRFNDKTSGLYVKKPSNNYSIPKILHQICLEDNIVDTKAWGRVLRAPWVHRIWSKNDLLRDVVNGKWSIIFQENPSIFAAFAILEKYGGIVIDSTVLPLKTIPDELLSNRFFLGFSNESLSTSLSYSFMGSVPGYVPDIIDDNHMEKANSISGFTGINNFFRNVQKKDRKELVNRNDLNPNLFPSIFNDIHSRHMNGLDEIFLENPSVVIYPSYYFNPDHSVVPKHLLQEAVCYKKYKEVDEIEPLIKTPLRRTYDITPKGIIAKLKENPRDRLKNIKRG